VRLSMAFRLVDFWTGLALVLVGAVYAYGSEEIFVPLMGSDLLGPRAFPLGIGVVLALLGTLIMLRTILSGGEDGDFGSPRVLVILVSASAAYILTLLPLGYLVSTTLFLAFLFNYLGERRIWMTGLISVGVTLALYVTFHRLLHVALPPGIFSF